MADRSITIAIEGRVSGFVSNMKTAQKATEDFASRTASFARDNEQHLDRVGKASMLMGGALLAGFALAIKSYMEFDSAMSEVQASTHATSGELDQLREAAVNAGADTSFSAKEAAQAIDELAKAGVSTKDILGGGLSGALNLAAAGGMQVAKAAEIAATAMTVFGKNYEDKGKLAVHVSDLLAAGAGKAQGSVEDMGMALNQTGLVAKQTGLSIEETTGGLAAFASAGLMGSDAGTSMKTMLQRLTPQSKEAAEKMAELGISAYDSSGHFIGLSKFAENLQTSMKDLTPEARNAAMGIIFGSDAVRAANVLYENGGKGIQDWIGNVNEAGYAALTAGYKQNNLAGDIEKLGGSFDSVLIKGGSGAAQALRGLVQGAEDLVDAIGKIPTPILNAAVGIAGVVGGALLLAGAVGTLLPKWVDFKDSLDQIAPKGSTASKVIGGIGRAAGGATVALIGLQAAASVFTEKDVQSAEDYGQAILRVQKFAGDNKGLDSLFQSWDKAFNESTVQNVNSMSDAIGLLFNHSGYEDFAKGFDGFNKAIGAGISPLGQVEAKLKGLGEQMGTLTKGGSADTAAKTFNLLTEEFKKNGKGAQEALDKVPGYKDALLGLANQAGVTLSSQELLDFAIGKVPASMAGAATAVETYTTKAGNAKPMTEAIAKALEEVGLSAAGAITNVDNFAKSLFAAGLLNLSASDAAIAYQDSIDKLSESVKKNGTTLDINTEAGRANQSAYNNQAQAAMASMEATAKQTLATDGAKAAQDQLQAGLRTSYDDLVKAAGQFGITGDEADTMARKALGVPKNVNIDAWIADHASTTLDGIKGKADNLDGRQVFMDIYATTHETTLKKTIEDPGGMGSGVGGRDNGSLRGGMATGGRVYGPGTTTSDSIPVMLSKDEYVLKASAAKAIGYDNLNRLNGADTQPLRAGFQYSPAAAPARQSVAAAEPVRGSGVSVGQINITQVDDPIGTSHAVTRRMSALAI
jgi:TP901 family phage tail tape measure protein